MRIICLGDSLTLGIANSELNRWPVQVALGLEQEWPGEYEVFTRAFNGATTADALNKIEGEVGWLLPGIVLVALGVNDALVRNTRRFAQVGVEDFLRNLEDIHQLVAAKGGRVVFVAQHVPTPDNRAPERRFYVAGNGRAYSENFEPYRRALLVASRVLEAPVIDLPLILNEAGATSAELVMADGLHLTDEGNATYAKLILRALRTILPPLASTIERKAVQHA
jgi:lysophospholipase L1-like esterase